MIQEKQGYCMFMRANQSSGCILISTFDVDEKGKETPIMRWNKESSIAFNSLNL